MAVGVPMIVLETALIKFTATIVEALGREPIVRQLRDRGAAQARDSRVAAEAGAIKTSRSPAHEGGCVPVTPARARRAD
jgi:hypothetical protein